MANPIKNYIIENLEATINGITTANSYQQDLVAVRSKRIDYTDVTPGNGKVLIVSADEETLQGASGITDKTITYYLFAWVMPSTDTTEIDLLNDQVSADIEKALTVDLKRGAYARTTRIISINPMDTPRREGVEVVIEVDFRTLDTDPYTKA